jgi:hypothetical protein
MDPLSEVLSLLKPRTHVAGGFEVGGPWSVHFGPHDGIKCYAVVCGTCWLAVEGVPNPVHLKTGDCLLLTRGWPFRLASDLTLAPVDALSAMAASGVKGTGRMASFNGGKDCCMVGGLFAFAGNHADLLGVLPPIVHLRKESDKAAMRWSLEHMMEELREPQPGGFLVSQHLAHMMLVQALRLHMADGANGEVGWLFAMADSQIRTAIECIHSNPAHRWTVEELAQHAGMSRSGFALRFKETVGEAPMEYLTRWRSSRRRTGCAIQTTPLQKLPFRWATNPRARSAPPSSDSWDVRLGSTAGARKKSCLGRRSASAWRASNWNSQAESREGRAAWPNLEA